jgi:hypothetical protein
MLPGRDPPTREDIRQFAIADADGPTAFVIDCELVGKQDAKYVKQIDSFLASMEITPR